MRRVAAAFVVALLVLAGFAWEPASAASTGSSASAGGATAAASSRPPLAGVDRSCAEYIPRDLAINVPNAAPGQTVTITGIASPGDTVTIRISTIGGPPIVLGTATAGPDGFFTANVTIPANFVEGTYDITVSSPLCDGVSTITIVVSFPQGRCTARKTIVAKRGDTVVWTLLGVLDKTKPVKVLLVPVGGGPTIVVYTGAYPASGKVTFTVPSNLPNGLYRIVESGTGPNGKPRSARCGRLRVRGGGGGGTTTTTTTKPTTTTTIKPTTTTSGPGSTTTTKPTTTTTSTTSTTVPGTCEGTKRTYTFAPTKLIDFDGFNPKVEYTPILPVTLGQGVWTILEAISRDAYPNRVNVQQWSEVWEIEFLNAGGNVVARSQPTGDVPDFTAYGEWIGPLGTVTLPSSVTGVRAHHLPDLYPDAPFEPANSVSPISFTICQGGGGGGSTTTTTTKPTTTTTIKPTTTTSTKPTTTVKPTTTTKPTTTVKPTTTTTKPGSTTTTTKPGSTTTTKPTTTTTTAPDDDDDGGGGGGSTTSTTTTTVAGATTTTSTPRGIVTPTSVLGATATRTVNQVGSTRVASASASNNSSLAFTGGDNRPFVIVGIALIALGSLVVLGARRRRS
ncbi:MAG: hypothetical protein U0Q22_19230 [Acidimicrobiales bacterium]